MCYIGERERERKRVGNRKNKPQKETTMNISIVVLNNKLDHPSPPACTNFETQIHIEAEKSMTDCFIGEKERWINKSNGEQGTAYVLIHNTISHTLRVEKLSKS